MEKTVTKEDENIRLDQWVMMVSGHSRSRVQKMMEQGLILVNGKKGKKVRAGFIPPVHSRTPSRWRWRRRYPDRR